VKEGFLESVKKVKKDFDELDIVLKYHNDEPVIKELTRESKPGLRKYISYKDIKPHKGGLGLKVLTTSKGLMTDKEAIKAEIGGVIICRVF
jgi:small subunit ribosomal protein S8